VPPRICVGWCGDQGVQLFLVASGFGLTWGLLQRETGNSFPPADFHRRRGKRVLPLWWTAHLLFFCTWAITGWGMSLAKPASYLSFFGMRITLGSFYYFAPAWWFIGLLLQLYLVFPFLWSFLKRRGPLWLLVVGSSVALLVRGVGLLVLVDYLDLWSRGGVFITRLPEFLFGMSLAAWYFGNPVEVDRVLRRPLTLTGAVGLYLAGTCLSFFLLGMTLAPSMVGVGAFLLLYPPLTWLGARRGSGIGIWIGRHSCSLFLMHHPFILLLVAPGFGGTVGSILKATFLVLAVTVLTALILERAASWGFEALGFRVLDLRAVLSLESTGGECVYRTRNMHWTEEGHRRVAAHVAEYLTENGL
jgi:peptidoglycan/LPS O-acetylase OafA/YrhL